MRSRSVMLLSFLLLSCTGEGDRYTDAGPDAERASVDSGVTEVTLTITRSGNSDGVVTSVPAGVECGATCTMTVAAGTTVTLTAAPDAFTDFTGWSGGGCTGAEPCAIVVIEDVAIDAAFDLQRFTLDVEASGTGTGTVMSAPAGIACGDDCTEDYDHGTLVTLTATPAVGTTFLGWTGGACTGTTAPCAVNVTADVTIQATFGLDHSLNVTKAGNGTGLVTSNVAGIDCGSDCDQVYPPGTTVILTGAATGDSYFVGWSGGGCEGTAPCTVTVDTDAIAVTATFTLYTHTLDVAIDGTGDGEVSSSPIGIDCGTDCTHDFDSGTDVVLTPAPSAGRFAAWTGGGCTGLGPCTVDVTADTTVTATFELITITGVTSPSANGVYPAGASIPIEVTFSYPVTVTGVPTLSLNSGGTATYASGSGSTTLTFTYVVGAGENTADLDYASTTALALAGGAIADALGNAATLALATPGTPGSLGNAKAIAIDTAAPTVTGVSSTALNATYSIGAVINVQVSFSENVIVTGTPVLSLSSGAPPVAYAGGSGTSTLTFAYTVAAGQNAADLDCASAAALAANGGTIRDAATNAAVLTVPVGAAAGSLATAKNLVVDTAVPTVSSVSSSTTNGTYGLAATIAIQVTFSETVVVTGAPTLALGTGGSAVYSAGSGTAVLTFTYTVGAGHNTADLDYASTTALALAGGSIDDSVGNDATLTLPAVGGAGSLGANKSLVVDTAGPTVSGVTSSTANGSYGAAAAISIQVTFTESVLVTGTPALSLNSGGTATYASGSGTATLSFTYTVGASQNTADLDYTGTTALSGGTIRDGAGNSAILTLAAPGAAGSLGAAKAIVIDTVAPTVTGVTSSTANGTYGVGTAIPVQVTFSEAVTVATATPTLTLNTGGTAAYASGSGTTTLTFTYTVGASQNTADLDYSATAALALNGATIRDAAANNATLTLPTVGAAGSLGAAKAIVIDTAGATITGVTSSTADGSYGAGSSISIQVTFTEAVTVATATPTLALNTGATAAYASGSGTTVLTFGYTVGAAQNTADLDYGSTTALALNGATIRDAGANNANLTLPAAGAAGSLGASKALVIDTTVPTVTSVTSSTANGSYGAGAAISIQVVLSEAVNVTGSPALTLNTGATAAYASGTGTATLTFTYTVAASQNTADLDYTATTALSGGTIRDAALNAATLTLPAPGAAGSLGANKALVIDTIAPTVTGVSSTTAAGSYGTGTAIPIQVAFSEAVNVVTTGGTPSLALNSGGTATYTSGTGTATLTFTYTVGAAQTAADLDYAAASSLVLGGGTIRDAAQNAATLTLPAPGGAGSLGANEAIAIDTTPATVASVTSSTANGSFTVGGTIAIQVTFSEAVTVTGTPTLALNSGGSASYASGSGTSVLTFSYSVAAGHNSADLDYATTGALAGTIRDDAGNASTLTLPAVGGASSLGGTKALVVDTTAPTVTNVTSSTANGTYGASTVIPIQVTFTEPVTVAGGTPTLALNTGATASYASGSGTATLTFSYTVASGHNTADLNYAATSSLALGTATIRDLATNAATLTLPALAAAGSLGTNKALVIDTAAPTVTGVTSSTANGSYGATQPISIQIGFSEAVTVTGTPTLALNTGGTASFTSGSTTSTLTLTYTVGAGQNSGDLDYTSTGSLTGTITDAVGNVAVLTLPAVGGAGSLGANKNLVIDTVAPTVTNVTSSTPDGTYTTGAAISLQVVFSEAVQVTGTPTLALSTGVNASYASGSGTSSLTFAYTVSAGQTSPDLNYASSAALAGTIRDAASNGASLALPATNAAGSLAANKNLVIDTTAPTVTNVSSPNPDGTYRTGSVTITVQFTEPVYVAGSPTLALNSGGTATYTAGTATTTLSFTYTLVNGQNSADLDETATTSLALNGGTIRDVAGNPAVITLPAPQAVGSLGFNKRLLIDTGPIIVDVTSFENDGVYGAGTQFVIQVTFNEQIDTTGAEYLYLNSGGLAVPSDSGGDSLYLTYTVEAGQTSSDLDYSSATALVTTGTIRDAFGTDATLTLPAPGAPGSLGSNKNIVIVDGVTRFSAGTNEWPDSACNATTTFGRCSTNDRAYADAWSTYTCQRHGYTSGSWTGTKYGFCGGAESFYCDESTATCAVPVYERSCQSGDQTNLQFTCWGAVHARWDPGFTISGVNFTNKDRSISQATTTTRNVRATVGRASGKYYWEIDVTGGSGNTNGGGLGIVGPSWPSTASWVGSQAESFGFGYGGANTQFYSTWAGLSAQFAPPSGTAVQAGNTYMFAVDLDADRLWIGMNGTWFNDGGPATNSSPTASGVSGTIYPAVTFYGSSANSFTANFGSADFRYTVPFGFRAGWY